MKKLISLLLSAIMLLVPVLGCADTVSPGYAYFSISDPYMSMVEDGETIEFDLSGLELKLAAEESENALNLLVGLLANGSEALTGYASFDEINGLRATLDGMNSGISIPMETIESFLEMLMAELETMPADVAFSSSVIGGADGPTSIVVNTELGELPEFFSEEALTAYTAELGAFVESIEISDPYEDTIPEGDGDSAAQRVDFAISSESLASFLKATGDLLMTNEEFAAGYAASFEESGSDYVDLGETMYEAITVTDMSLEGSIFMTEAENIYMLSDMTFINDYDENEGAIYHTVTLYASITSDEDGDYVYISAEDEINLIDFFLSVCPSTEVEGGTDYYFEFTMNEYDTQTGSLSGSFFPYYDEDGTLNYLLDVTADDGYESFNFGCSCYGGESAYGAFLYFTVINNGDEEPEGEIYLNYDGVISEDGNTHTGLFEFALGEYGEEIINLSCNVAFGLDTTGESIAYDYTGVELIDITTADDETFEKLGTDAGNAALIGVLTLAQEIPLLSELMGSM